MKIKILGNSGSYLSGRKLPSFLLNSCILLDAGASAASLTIEAQAQIKYIFITHAHLDHIKDIPFLADNLILNKSFQPIRLFSIKEVIEDLKNYLFNFKIWPDFSIIPSPYNSILRFETLEEEKPVLIEKYKITAYRMNHSVPAVGYFVEAENKNFFYTGDTTYYPETWKKLADKEIKFLIAEVSFPDEMESLALNTGHLTPKLLYLAVSHFREAPEKIFIFHLKFPFEKVIKKELRKYFKNKVKFLKSGEVISL